MASLASTSDIITSSRIRTYCNDVPSTEVRRRERSDPRPGAPHAHGREAAAREHEHGHHGNDDADDQAGVRAALLFVGLAGDLELRVKRLLRGGRLVPDVEGELAVILLTVLVRDVLERDDVATRRQ